MMWAIRKGCRLFKCFGRLLVCVSRTTIFLIFTFSPPLCKAIWISSKLHLDQLWRLIAWRYRCHNFKLSWSALEGQELSWLDKMLFHHLMACYTQTDSWHGTYNGITRKTLNTKDDIEAIKSSVFNRNVEDVQTHLLLKRAVIAYFVKYLVLPIVQLQLHFAEMQYALSWTLYQMVFRPPLAFLYLLSTIANEFSWYLDSLVNHLINEKSKNVPINEKNAVCHNTDRIKLGDIQIERNCFSEAKVQCITGRQQTKVSMKTTGREPEGRFLTCRTPIPSPNVSPIKFESLEVKDRSYPFCLPSSEQFCFDKFFESQFDANRVLERSDFQLLSS